MQVGRARLLVLFGAFVMLGLPEGVLGTAWPSIRADFDRPGSALATLLIAYTVGYLVSSAGLGRIVDKVGNEIALRAGLGVSAVGLLLYGLTPVWTGAVVAAATLGTGAGLVDATVNAEVALHHGQRTMNLLHASFGIGATLGPLLITSFLSAGVDWWAAYLGLGVAELVILGLLVVAAAGGSVANREPVSASRYATPAKRPDLLVAATLLYFALYVGAEVAVGQWTFSVLTEARGVSTTTAGLAVASYWGGLTAGRLLLGWLGDRIHPMTLMRGAGVVELIAIIWFLIDGPGSLVALPLLGLAFAGVFPALVLMTSSWLDAARVTRVVGWQLAASSVGAIVSSAAIGAVASRWGLDATVIAMLVLIVGLLGAHLATEAAVA